VRILQALCVGFVLTAAFSTCALDEPKADPKSPAEIVSKIPDAKPPETPAEPQKVYVGIYVNDIFGVSLADYKFDADFYVWFRWKGKLAKSPLATFQTANGRISKKDAELNKELGEWHYASCRVIATFQAHWELRHFPFDKQTLAIEIEDNEGDIGSLIYLPDTQNCALDSDIRLPGWVLTGTTYDVKQHQYDTNYGDTSLPDKSVWSRFCVSIHCARPGIGYFFKLCWGLLIAMLIALVPMFLKPTDGPRFGLGTGALFAAMANAYVISNALPKDTGMTTADMFFVLALSAIFVSLCESIISLIYFTADKKEFSKRLDRVCFWVVLVAYAASGAILLLV
jgi:hypothetical protein